VLPPVTFEYYDLDNSFTKIDYPIKYYWGLRGFGKDGTFQDHFDIDGDGLSDSVSKVLKRPAEYRKNSGSDLLKVRPISIYDDRNLRHTINEGSAGNSTIYDFIDMDNDGLPDRVEKNWNDCVKIYLNKGHGNFYPRAATWCDTDEFPIRYYGSGGKFYCVTDFLDMNADGLPDRVVKFWDEAGGAFDGHLKVMLNNGAGFDSRQNWTLNNGDKTDDRMLRYGKKDFRGKLDTIYDYIDLNGDGLPDRVEKRWDQKRLIWLNNGNGFENARALEGLDDGYALRDSISNGHAIADFMDMNGDGLLDRVIQWEDYDDGVLKVQLNIGNCRFASPVPWGTPGNHKS
jgi:hypothetical protein